MQKVSRAVSNMHMGVDIVHSVILIFRTWAIWGQKRKVAFGLPILLVVVVIPLAYLTRIGLTSVTCPLLFFFPQCCITHTCSVIVADVTKLPIPNLQSCFIIKNDDITIMWDYVIIIGFETGEDTSL